MSARSRSAIFALIVGFGLAACATPGSPSASTAASPATGGAAEAATERAFDALRGDSARLVVFLREMPKGGDLHNHLSGAVYAEGMVAWADSDGACLRAAALTVVAAGQCGDSLPTVHSELQADPLWHDRLVDAFSMRNYHPATQSGHDRFFQTFGRFSAATDGRTGDMLAEVSHRAADNHERYLELMDTPGFGSLAGLAFKVGWDNDWDRMRQKLLAAGLRDTLKVIERAVTQNEARRDALLGCKSAQPDEGCAVTVRYDYQVLRAMPPAVVFTQILAGYELAAGDPRFVGFNLVQPEDDPVAMRDYTLHMRIIQHLHAEYPTVPVSLHAGELVLGLVPPEGLRFHITQAVEIAGARRIGHGVDVLQEHNSDALLREMARTHVAVEINLTSNDVILGVRGARHPFHTYLAYGVPVLLSTDDEGVSRSDMTHEWVRAVEDQHVDYRTLKAMARNSLEYAFVEGASLWADYAALRPGEACDDAHGGLDGASCRAYTATSQKARLEASLERDSRAFEARMALP